MMHLGPMELVSALCITRNLRPADVRELEATRYGHLDRDALAFEMVNVWTINSNAWIAYGSKGLPVCAFGATQPWPRCYSCWLLATDDFADVALPVTKFVKRVFIPWLRQRARRIEARSIDGHGEAHAWLSLLGAKVEARLKHYGRDGDDFLVFTLDPEYVDNVDYAMAGSLGDV